MCACYYSKKKRANESELIFMACDDLFEIQYSHNKRFHLVLPALNRIESNGNISWIFNINSDAVWESIGYWRVSSLALIYGGTACVCVCNIHLFVHIDSFNVTLGSIKHHPPNTANGIQAQALYQCPRHSQQVTTICYVISNVLCVMLGEWYLPLI